ncbi:MAG: hypothetical protein LCI00_33185 [Chloroflexi bacterium]|nr:hypothetical protein [Chloroflexota bacterium]
MSAHHEGNGLRDSLRTPITPIPHASGSIIPLWGYPLANANPKILNVLSSGRETARPRHPPQTHHPNGRDARQRVRPTHPKHHPNGRDARQHVRATHPKHITPIVGTRDSASAPPTPNITPIVGTRDSASAPPTPNTSPQW